MDHVERILNILVSTQVWLVATFASVLSVQSVFFADCHRARGDIEVGLYTTAPFLAAYAAVELVLAVALYLPAALAFAAAAHCEEVALFGAVFAGLGFYFALLSLLTCACAYTHEDARWSM